MKILHIAPNAVYNDYWGYQDNLLPKYHRKAGHEVTVITTVRTYVDKKVVNIEAADYVLNDGTRVIRIPEHRYRLNVLTNLFSRLNIWDKLLEIQPDFIFFHGLISITIKDAVRYKKKINPECVIVQDSHMDYFNSPIRKSIKSKIIRAFYRYNCAVNMPYIERVYGVTPWRKIYAEDYFAIPENKTDLLIMGADDENIDFRNRDEIRKKIRKQHGIDDDEFLIVTGGKLDYKKKTLQLMTACKELKNVSLLIFGSVSDEIKDEFNMLLSSCSRIIYIGWIDSDKVYDYFLTADLVCFPGSHSVMWEQACACKVPCLFEKIEGMEHVNNGGNSEFISDVTETNLENKIKSLVFTDKYQIMKRIAESEATDIYLYSNIAKKSLECSIKK